MIPALKDHNYKWQEQELQEEYEFLEMQIRESGMDPDEYQGKVKALAMRLGISLNER